MKPVVGLLAHLGLVLFFEYLFVHRWLGYPLYPGTATNALGELLWINAQILFWVLVFIIPSLLLATIAVYLPYLLYWFLIIVYVAASVLFEEWFGNGDGV